MILSNQFSSGATNSMLNYKVISAILENTNGDLWVATEGGGINYYTKKTGEFTYYTHDANNSESLSSNNVKSMIRDKQGNLWIGTHDGGLNFLDVSKKPYRFKHFDQKQQNGIQIKDYRILCLLEDANQNIWIGTLTGGLFFYDREQNIFTKLDYYLKSAACILQSNDPNIIFAGGTKGVEKININTKHITTITYQKVQNNYS